MSDAEVTPARSEVAVIIPAREAAGTLADTLASIRAQTCPPREIAIAVGPSADGTRAVATALAAEDPRIVVVDNPSGRTPDALNRALAATSAPIVARVDAHSQLPPSYLARAVRTLQATGAGNVGGRQVPKAQHGFARAVALAMASPLGAGGAAYRSGDTAGPVDTVYLGVFRRAALESVGRYDPRFVRNQDAELNLRLAAAGHVVWFDPGLAVDYQPRSTLRGLIRQYGQYGRWRRLTVRVHPSSLRPRQLAAPVLVLGLGAAGLAGILLRSPRPVAAVLGGYLAAVVLGTAAAVEHPADVPATALATVTMHVSWGVGFWLGPPRGSGRPTPLPVLHDG